MRFKERVNTEMMKLFALERRVPDNHKKKEEIVRAVKVKQSEVKGEKEVGYTIDLLDGKYYVLDYVRLPDYNGYFQMDILLLSPSFILIVEVKNWLGTIIFGQNGQVTQINPDGKENGYKNPVPQVKTQAYRLKLWLLKNGFPNIPILYHAVISFPSTIIQPATPQITIPKEIIHNSDLLFKIHEIERNFTKEYISKNQLYRMAQLIKASHVPQRFDVLERYKILSDDLIKGVFCPKCHWVPMIRLQRKWVCRNCKSESKDAHYAALNDYLLLHGERITNKELRDWLQVESRHVVKRLLKKAGFEVKGDSTAGSYYQLKLRF